METLLTYRRDQRGFAGRLEENPNLNGDELVGGVLFCRSVEARQGWITRLRKNGWNHFTCFRDVQSPHALMFGKGV